jgi:hypothetical protein
MKDEEVFKKCPMCVKVWKSRDEFLDDCYLRLEGYSADFEIREKGLFYFTHRVPGCFSTMALEAWDFLDLYSGEKYPTSKMGTDECSGFCLERKNLDHCPAHCELAFVREIIQIIKNRHISVSDPVVRDARCINEKQEVEEGNGHKEIHRFYKVYTR